MKLNLKLNPKIILSAALVMFGGSMLLVFIVLFLIGVITLLVTQNFDATLESLSAIGHSTSFRLIAHTIHMIVASFVGYRLVGKLRRGAILNIWVAILLAVFVHFSVHAMMGVSMVEILTEIRFLKLPTMMIVGAFIGLHSYYWHRYGVLIKT